MTTFKSLIDSGIYSHSKVAANLQYIIDKFNDGLPPFDIYRGSETLEQINNDLKKNDPSHHRILNLILEGYYDDSCQTDPSPHLSHTQDSEDHREPNRNEGLPGRLRHRRSITAIKYNTIIK